MQSFRSHLRLHYISYCVKNYKWMNWALTMSLISESSNFNMPGWWAWWAWVLLVIFPILILVCICVCILACLGMIVLPCMAGADSQHRPARRHQQQPPQQNQQPSPQNQQQPPQQNQQQAPQNQPQPPPNQQQNQQQPPSPNASTVFISGSKLVWNLERLGMYA